VDEEDSEHRCKNVMEEIITLRKHLQEQRYDEALLIALELEDMSRDDKINHVVRYAEILLLYLIKQEAEQRMTLSWDVFAQNAADHIANTNYRREVGEFYLERNELAEAVDEAYNCALRRASLEAFEGIFLPHELQQKFDKQTVLDKAMAMIVTEQAKRV
jgi:hypothetical protein